MNPGFSVSKCAILADPRDPERHAAVDQAVKELMPELKRVGIQAASFVRVAPEDIEIGHEIDLFVVLGGDGAMIHFAGKLGHLGVPFYGLNYGNVGFMMNNAQKGLRHHAEKLKADIFSTWSFPVLRMEAIDHKGDVHHGMGLNDIYLQRMTAQSCKASIKLDGIPMKFNPLLCDGVIVATPLGSTAYSYNLTGSMVAIDTPVITMTPIAAQRSCPISCMVLPQTTRIEFEILEPAKRRVQVVSDGQSHGDIIHTSVWVSDDRVKLCFDPKDSRSLAMRFIDKACS